MKRWSLRSPRAWLVPALTLAGVLVLLATGGNEPAFLWLNRLGPATSDVLWANLTILGDTTVALALCLPLARRRPDLLWALVPAGLLATGWAQLLKPLVDVARPPAVLSPDVIHVIGPAYRFHSMPSGHATTAFAFAALFVLGFDLRGWSFLPVGAAVLIAMSRCVLGVHWPLDLLAGAFGGWLAALLGIRLAARLPFGLQPPAQWAITLALAGCAVALLTGYRTDYPQALWFQRTLGAASLLCFALSFVSRSGSDAAGDASRDDRIGR